ncbi:DivIVA domain-containing protein [Deinococcus radiodurans]|nr:DivIVA domain-containing protein [Deinococcus radiodurans]
MSSPNNNNPSGKLSPRDITHQSFDGRMSGYDKGRCALT